MADRSHDNLLDALAAARPEPPPDFLVPDLQLFDDITRTPRVRARNRPRILAVSAAAAAVAIIGAGLALVHDANPSTHRTTVAVLAPADLQRIAARSNAALRGTGRADTAFSVDAGLVTAQRGTATLAFAGDNLDMVIHFAGAGRATAFDAANRTVNGEFYLLDGPPNAKRWYHDVNASGTRGTDLFSADPRTLLAALQPAVRFEVVGDDVIDGVKVRHLRATHVDELPALNLSLGPIDPASITNVDVWAGADDVVRRFDIATRTRETHAAGARSMVVRDKDGNRTKVTINPPDAAHQVTTVHEATYSVRFYDLGAPITVTAPTGAVEVVGRG